MSRYRKVELHLKQLRELQSIIASMKTLSQLELRKLTGIAESQSAMVQILEQVVSDFLLFFPQAAAQIDDKLWLVIGSERGFCGPFNEILVNQLFSEWPECVHEPHRVLAVGRKLCWRLDERLPGYEGLTGASTAEEVQKILTRVVSAIRNQLIRHNLTSLQVLFVSDERGKVINHRLLPPEDIFPSSRPSFPPRLYLEPGQFLSEFMQHYLFLSLARLFSVSLLNENRYRVQHLGGAVHRLDDRLALLQTKARSLRQEEITEEIEMILLGSGAFDTFGEVK